MRDARPVDGSCTSTVSQSTPRQDLVLVAALAVSHVLFSWPTLYLYSATSDVPAVYLASGIAWAGFMLLAGRARLMFAALVFLSQFGGELLIYGSPLWIALVFSLSKTAGAALGALAVQRAIGRPVMRPLVSDITWFGLVGAIAVPLLAALPPQLAKVYAFDAGIGTYVGWVLLEATGIIVMAPALVFWLQPAPRRNARLQAGLLSLVTVIVFAGVFVLPPAYEHQHTAFYAATPVMIWAAARFGCRGAALENLGLTLTMLAAALAGLGPFDNLSDLNLSVIEMQAFLIVMSGMTLLLGAYADMREADQRRRIADQRRLQQLSLRLFESEERYREQIATRLHDGVGQSLALGRMRLDDYMGMSTRVATGASPLSNVRDAIDRAVSQVRDMTRDVAVGLYRGDNLGAALEHHLADVFRGTDIQTAFLSEALPELRHDVAVVLSRATRECLVNAAKHADPARVTVELASHEHPERLFVRIHDDGRGFDSRSVDIETAKSDSFGLASVRNSMLALGGAFTLTSASGAGTTVTLSLPMSRATVEPRASVVE